MSSGGVQCEASHRVGLSTNARGRIWPRASITS